MIQIDVKRLNKEGININQYLTLLGIQMDRDNKLLDFKTSPETLHWLREEEYIEANNGKYILTNKGEEVLSDKSINFEELLNIYPKNTPSGRVLRPNKDRNGKINASYVALENKYLSRVRHKELHTDIVEATKRMVNSKQERDLNYLPELVTYINGQQWEKYWDLLDSPIKSTNFSDDI